MLFFQINFCMLWNFGMKNELNEENRAQTITLWYPNFCLDGFTYCFSSVYSQYHVLNNEFHHVQFICFKDVSKYRLLSINGTKENLSTTRKPKASLAHFLILCRIIKYDKLGPAGYKRMRSHFLTHRIRDTLLLAQPNPEN